VQAALGWFAKHLGLEFRSGDVMATTVQVLDRQTGEILYQLRSPQCRFPVIVSPDLLRAASFTHGKGLMMWNLDSGSRWPWAVLALIPAALWVGFRRFRRRSPLQQSA
jgi:hypothetical protein